MTLYVPRSFAVDDLAAARRLVEAHPFATLITSAIDGTEPHVSHLPLLWRDDALWGHVARPNPHWMRFAQGRTVAVFHGPHAYVSPRWYEAPADNVPTWNYATVHVSGTPELLDDEGARRVLVDLTDRFEGGAWRARPEHVARMVRGIVAFRLSIERWEAKFKMNQNKTPGDRAGVIGALVVSANPDDQAVARWMRES